MRLLLGGHLRATDGLRFLVTNTRSLDYTVVQTMLGGKDDYSPMEISGAAAAEFRQMMYGVELYVHMPYTINPCEDVPQRRGYYKKTFKEFCAAASQLGAKGVVIHPGFKKQLTREAARDNLVKFFDSAYEEDWHLQILIETDSGSKNGSAIGDLAFIKEAIDILNSRAYAMCLDTEHLYARGIDLWNKEVRDRVLKEYGHLIRLVHMNSPDPEVELGSFRDRHSTPFEQRQGWDHKGLFEAFMQYPMILERSSLAVQEQDAKFIRTLLGDEGATRGLYARTDARSTEKRNDSPRHQH